MERSYVTPIGMNASLVDRIWFTIVPLISLGYSEKEIAKKVSEFLFRLHRHDKKKEDKSFAEIMRKKKKYFMIL